MAPLRESGTRRIFEVSATAIAGPEAVARELEKHVRWEPQTNEHPGAVIIDYPAVIALIEEHDRALLAGLGA